MMRLSAVRGAVSAASWVGSRLSKGDSDDPNKVVPLFYEDPESYYFKLTL